MTLDRRSFLSASAAAAVAASTGSVFASASAPRFQISLAQWSLHKALKGGKLDNLDFAKVAKQEFGIEGIEYVNQFFKSKATDKKYLAEMNKRAADQGVTQLLIMVGRGAFGRPKFDWPSQGC